MTATMLSIDPNLLTFFFGLILLMIFGWFIASVSERRKRILGSVLAVLLVAFCLKSLIPPLDIGDSKATCSNGKLHLGIDLRGGVSFPGAACGPRAIRKITPQLQEQAVGVINKRINKLGVSEPVITPQGQDRILVQIPAIKPAEIELAKEQLQKVAKLEFKYVYPGSAKLIPAIDAGEAPIPPGYEIKAFNEPDAMGKPQTYRILVRARLTSVAKPCDLRLYAYFGNRWLPRGFRRFRQGRGYRIYSGI